MLYTFPNMFGIQELLLRLLNNATKVRAKSHQSPKFDEQGICQRTHRPFTKSSEDTKNSLTFYQYQLHKQYMMILKQILGIGVVYYLNYALKISKQKKKANMLYLYTTHTFCRLLTFTAQTICDIFYTWFDILYTLHLCCGLRVIPLYYCAPNVERLYASSCFILSQLFVIW